MTNVYARPAALSNVCGRVDYISNPERQEHLIATYSAVDLTFWNDLAIHCQKAAKEAGAEKACEGREWHGALPNVYATIYAGREEELAREISELFREITDTENLVALHWNKSMTNFHFHAVCSENKEINEIISGAVLTRNTYYDAEGKRSCKKDCVDQNGDLLPGCEFVPKGHRRGVYKRFGTKENLRHWEVNARIKQALADKFNGDLQREEFKVYKADALHLKTQKVGKGLPDELRDEIVEKNNLVKEWNRSVDDLLCTALEKSPEEFNTQYDAVAAAKVDVNNNLTNWVEIVKHYVEQIKNRINELKKWLQKRPETSRKPSFDEILRNATRDSQKHNSGVLERSKRTPGRERE